MTSRENAPTTEERAVSTAYLVPRGDFAATIHSAFANAFNIAVGDLLVTVHDSHMSHTPTSIRVQTTSSVPWSDRVFVGQKVTSRNGWLNVGETALNVSELPIWTPPRERQQNRTDSSVMRELERNLRDRAVAPVEWSADLRAAVARLRASVNSPHTDLADLSDAASALIGFGPGLTPSGDDVLVGVLSGLNAAGGASPYAARAAWTIANTIHACAHRTNDISRHYLRLAAYGHFGEALTALTDAVVVGAALPELLWRADLVLSVGASSGSDALAGTLIGLSAQLNKDHHTHPHTSSEKAA